VPDVAGAPKPSLFLAYTVNFHAAPEASLPMVTLVVRADTSTVTGRCPLAEPTTRYPVSGLPPMSRGLPQLTSADLTPALAASPVGAVGVLAR